MYNVNLSNISNSCCKFCNFLFSGIKTKSLSTFKIVESLVKIEKNKHTQDKIKLTNISTVFLCIIFFLSSISVHSNQGCILFLDNNFWAPLTLPYST